MVQYYKMRFKIEMELILNNTNTQVAELKGFLAFKGVNCVGYLIVIIDNERDSNAEIVNIFMTESCRNFYIGKHLLNSALFYCKLKRIRNVVCAVEFSNGVAVCFMEMNGFKLMNKLPLSKSGYSKLIDSFKHNDRCSIVYFRVINFYYLFFEIDLCHFN